MSNLKIVFAGTPEFVLPSLNALYESKHELLAVFTQPDRPAGRGRKMQPSAAKTWALENNVPVYQPLNFKSEESIAELANLKPDILVVIAYGLILPKRILALPRLGCINVHASKLPAWRGASPIQQAILHGDKDTGVTIMQMDAGMDTGDKLIEVTCPLYPHDTAKSLHDRLSEISAAPLLETLELLATGKASPQKQNNDLATYAPKINKEDAEINWQQSAEVIDRQIRGYNPWPIAYSKINEDVFRIFEAKIVDYTGNKKPGTVLSIDKKGILVATAKDAILIESIQFAGSKQMKVADWLNAKRDQLKVDFVLG